MVFMVFKIVITLVVIMLLMLTVLKLSSNKINNFNDKKAIKVIEKIQVSKETSICVVKILNKGYILSISPNNTTVINELTEDEVLFLEKGKKEEIEKISNMYSTIINNSTNVFKNIHQRNNENEN